jgi:elongation factor P
MTISINDINSGMGLVINGEIYLVAEYQHVKPGKGSAFVRVKLRNIKTDAVLERTFRSAEKLDEAALEERPLEYLYTAGDTFHFMDHSTYEEVTISRDEIGDGANFLLENLHVAGLYNEQHLLKTILPNFITAQITGTEPGIRGDSTKLGTKAAKIQTGASIQVPLFVNQGDWIKIDTRNGQYVERVQK